MAIDNFDLEKLAFPLTETDKNDLKITDKDFTPHTWDDLKAIIANNRLDVLRRWPSDLKRYIIWSAQTKAEYGTIMNFVMKNRLRWTPSSSSTLQTGPLFDFNNPVPFTDSRDYKIMPNDWPYGLDAGIQHLIVWLKNRLDTEPTQGDLTPASRAQVNAFVDKHFVKPVQHLPGNLDKVMWFKNWTSLQSVPGIDHIHVLVRDVPDDIIQSWTGSEQPVQATVDIA